MVGPCHCLTEHSGHWLKQLLCSNYRFRITTHYRNYTCQRHQALVMVIVKDNSGCTVQCLALISTIKVSTSSERIWKDEAKCTLIMSLCTTPRGISVAFLELCLVSQGWCVCVCMWKVARLSLITYNFPFHVLSSACKDLISVLLCCFSGQGLTHIIGLLPNIELGLSQTVFNKSVFLYLPSFSICLLIERKPKQKLICKEEI